MAITSSDVEWRYANPDASVGNQLGQRYPAKSLGGFVSQSVWPGLSLGDLFGDVSGQDNAAQAVDYRCLFFVNRHATLAATNLVAWLVDVAGSFTDLAIGVDPTPATPLGTQSPQAVATVSPTAVPPGVTFSAPASQLDGIALGDIPAGYCRAVWLRRTATNSAGTVPDDPDHKQIAVHVESAG